MGISGKPDARIGGPVSQTIRNTMKQLVHLAENGGVSMVQLQIAYGVMLDCAEQVERLETMAVPQPQRADPRDIESRKVLLFDEWRPEAQRLALGGAVTAPPRRTRGLWSRFRNILRRP